MGSAPLLDLDLLRTLTLIAEEGSFTRAADRVGRTQSAVSLQIQRLEAAVGYTVLSRSKGGSVELTEEGRLLVAHAQKMLALNAEVFDALKAPPEPRSVRLGAPEDHSPLYLSRVLAAFAEHYPGVTVELANAASCELMPRLKAGELDLMLCAGGHEVREWPSTLLWSSPLRWVGSREHNTHLLDPLPLVLSTEDCPFRPPWLKDCVWRGAALRALEREGRRYKVVTTSKSMAQQQAVARTGMALTVSTVAALGPGLRVLGPEHGLPELPETTVLLLMARAPRQPVTNVLAAHLVESFGTAMREAAEAVEAGLPSW